MFMLTLLFLTIFVVWCLFLRFSRTGRLLARIPGPKGLLILGNAFQFMLPPDKLFERSRNLYKQYKGLIQLHSFCFRCVNLYEPEDIEKVLSSMQFSEKKLPYDFLKPWLRDGLLVTNGPKWRQRRKMLTPAFHFNILKKITQMFAKHSEELLQEMDEKDFTKDPIDLRAFVAPKMLKIMCEISMGVSKENSLNLVAARYVEAIDTLGISFVERICRVWYFLDILFNCSTIGRKQKRIIEDIHSFTKNIISERRDHMLENGKEEESFNNSSIYGRKGNLSMLDLLLENEIEKKIDENGIREEVDTFVFAGYDTTATTLTFLIMRIANEPEVQDSFTNGKQDYQRVKATFYPRIPTGTGTTRVEPREAASIITIKEQLHKEMFAIFGWSERRPNLEDLNEMKYTECCIKECLRVYPSVPFISRYMDKEIVLSGYTIPANTHANIMIYDLHNREDIYPEPQKFIPERFLSENTLKRHPYAYIPFSAGQRNCLGQKFAMLEIKTILSSLLRKYRFEPVTKPEDLVFVTNIVLRTKDPVYVRFSKRK